MGKGLLHAAINRLLDDGARHIRRSDIVVFGGSNWSKIKAALTEWEGKGYLRIIKDPEFARDEEVCLEMLNYIDQKSPWRDWPPRTDQ
jgi:hypothetical protein